MLGASHRRRRCLRTIRLIRSYTVPTITLDEWLRWNR